MIAWSKITSKSKKLFGLDLANIKLGLYLGL